MPPQEQPGQNDNPPGSSRPQNIIPLNPRPHLDIKPDTDLRPAPQPMPEPVAQPQSITAPQANSEIPPGPITGLQNPAVQPSVINPSQPLPPQQPANTQQPLPTPAAQSSFATAHAELSANTPSGAFVGSDGPQTPFSPQKFGFKQSSKPGIKGTLTKKPIMALIVVAFLGLGFLGFWFGYYNNPKVVYSQAMSNTNKGYEKLVEYTKAESAKKYKSTSGTGKLNIKTSGTDINGTMDFKSSGENAQFNANIDLGIAKINADFVQVQNSKNGSDLYFKISGLKSISSLAGSPEFEKIISKTENTWIYVDPELAKYLTSSKSTSVMLKDPSTEQIMDAAQKIGEVNKKYLFTSNKQNAVMTVQKSFGKEDVDGHSAYKYQMTINPSQASTWIKAQHDAIKSSKLYDWMKQNDFAETFDEAADNAAKSTKDANKDTAIYMWVDAKTRLIYKVRFNDPKTPDNYFDLGLDYTGGNIYPMFLAFNTKYDQDSTNIKFQLSLDSKTNQMDLNLKAASKGSSAGEFDADFKLKPGNESYKIDKPANAKSLSQLLNELGYGEYIKQLQASATAAPQDDTILQ